MDSIQEKVIEHVTKVMWSDASTLILNDYWTFCSKNNENLIFNERRNLGVRILGHNETMLKVYVNNYPIDVEYNHYLYKELSSALNVYVDYFYRASKTGKIDAYKQWLKDNLLQPGS
jgi:hypothetical protein